LSGREVCEILVRNGIEELSQRGSHVNFVPPDGNPDNPLTVPLHRELKRGTLAAIVRRSGLPRTLFE
ncbi:MAG: type II toxin-antitoxin system HicA family toxin, partial [Chloroflexi bacterium]|nr:type II toxin-antitoxin system HicA family toxin [Chloroflexota bacterium]